jgi:hypothetical protein
VTAALIIRLRALSSRVVSCFGVNEVTAIYSVSASNTEPFIKILARKKLALDHGNSG